MAVITAKRETKKRMVSSQQLAPMHRLRPVSPQQPSLASSQHAHMASHGLAKGQQHARPQMLMSSRLMPIVR